MTDMQTHGTFAEAYVKGIHDLLVEGDPVPSVEDPSSVGSDFGRRSRPTLELIGYTFRVGDPGKCLLWWPERPLRLSYCVGSLLWTLAGSDDLDWIAFYNPRATDFSDDGEHVAAAFGKRLFAFHDRTDQIGAVLKRLSADRQSRRAVAVITSAVDNETESRGYPCAIAVQYMLRDKALHAVTYMRSQSALMVLPYDGFLFMALQQWLAHCIGVAVGTYTHVSGSFHVYEEEVPVACKALQTPPEALSLGSFEQSDAGLDGLLRFEKRIRRAATEGKAKELAALAHRELLAERRPSSFNAQARLVLLAHACEMLHLEEYAALQLSCWKAIRRQHDPERVERQ